MEGAQGNMKALLEHLCFLAQYLSESNLETVTAVFLIDLGFPAGKMVLPVPQSGNSAV